MKTVINSRKRSKSPAKLSQSRDWEDEEDKEWEQANIRGVVRSVMTQPEPVFSVKGKVWAIIITILFLYFRFTT